MESLALFLVITDRTSHKPMFFVGLSPFFYRLEVLEVISSSRFRYAGCAISALE